MGLKCANVKYMSQSQFIIEKRVQVVYTDMVKLDYQLNMPNSEKSLINS